MPGENIRPGKLSGQLNQRFLEMQVKLGRGERLPLGLIVDCFVALGEGDERTVGVIQGGRVASEMPSSCHRFSDILVSLAQI